MSQSRRRCSGVAAHRRRIGGRGKAPRKQDGSIDHLGEGRGGREDRSPQQTEVEAERLTMTVVLRWSTAAKVLRTSISEPWVMHCCNQLRLTAMGRWVTDGDRDDGGEDEHRRVSGRPNLSSKVVE
jgi:hypothetical protein